MGDLLDSVRRAQGIILAATKRGNSNWIRFSSDSRFHAALSRGDIKGFTLADARLDPDDPTGGSFIIEVGAASPPPPPAK